MASKRIGWEDRNVPWGLLNYFSMMDTLFSLLFLYNTVSKKLYKALRNKYNLEGKVKSFRSCLNLDCQPHISLSIKYHIKYLSIYFFWTYISVYTISIIYAHKYMQSYVWKCICAVIWIHNLVILYT